MVSALVSGPSGAGSSPAQGQRVLVCSWTRHFILTVSLSTQVYKWVPERNDGVTLR